MIRKDITNFNSIKVRLELDDYSMPCMVRIFQFHKGAIRTMKTIALKNIIDTISIP